MLRHQLKPAIRRERRALLSSGVCLQHDNARPPTDRHTVKQIHEVKLELLSHPPYSSDLAATAFHLFWPLKTHYVTSLQIGMEVNEAVHAGWHSNHHLFYRGIYGLVERCRKFAVCGGDYTED